MATIKQIQFKRSPTAGKVPTTAQVAEGELALNLNDKIIYTNDGTSVVEVGQGFRGELPATANLDSYGPDTATRGVWSKATSTNSNQANGFPEENAVGTLEVFAGGQFGGYQRYTVRSGNIYVRSLTATWNGTNGPWNEWRVVGGSARALSASINLNNLGNAADLGIWRNSSSTLATLALGYPEEGSNCQGVLEVLEGGGYGRTQRYTTRTGSIYVRNLSATWNSDSPSWDVWKSVGYQVAGAYFTGDLNDLTDPGKYSVTSAALNLPMVITGVVEVTKRLDGVNTVQEFTTTGSGSDTRGRKFVRVKSGAGTGTWGAWDEIYTSSSLQLNLGLGKNVIELASLDWQTFDFQSGAIYGVANTTMTNVPAGAIIDDVSYYVNIIGRSGTAIEYQLTARTTNNSRFRVQYIRSSGAAGSRTFYVRELANTTNTNKWSALQTFSDITVNGNTKNSSITFSKTNATTSTVNDIVLVSSGDSLSTPAGTVRNRFEIKDSVNNLISLTRRTNNALEATVEGTIRANEFVSTAANSYRILGSEYGSFIRNSGSYTYFLLTNKDAQSGTYNALRPITIHNPSGRVDFGNGIALTGNNTFSIGTGSSIKFNGDTANVWDFSTSTGTATLNYTGTSPTTSKNIKFTKEGDIRADRRVYSGGSFMNTDGNISGSIWNKYGGSTNLDAVIGNQTFLKADNLAGIQDRAAAWLNVRPLGSTPLAGDAVNDYDAVTYRQLKNSSGGSGPSMNGVMNYGVGSFHLTDSRAFLQRYEVFSDGQLLNRADYPDLWAFAQLHSPITDAAWLADWAKRGRYSSGNGTTTFRVPDRNGVQPGSIRALFARGDGGDGSNAGEIRRAHLPNITGALGFHGQGNASAPGAGTTLANGSGAMVPQNQIPRYVNGSSLLTAAPSYGSVNFNAASSNPVYNRYPDLPDEVLPRNFVGVWTIRASGGFTAANTSWSVINGDTTLPPTGTIVYGGTVSSEYKVGTTTRLKASLEAYEIIGRTDYDRGARIAVTSGHTFRFTDSGTLGLPPNGVINSENGILTIEALNTNCRNISAVGGSTIKVLPTERNTIAIYNQTAGAGFFVNQIAGDWYDGNWVLGGVRGGGTNLDRVQLNVNDGVGSGATYLFGSDGIARAQQWLSISDIRVKEDIKRIENPLEKMKHLKGVSWKLKTNGSIGHGFIAQDVEIDFPAAVSTSSNMELQDGTTVENVKSVDTSGVAAALHHEAILALMAKVESLEIELAKLKS